MLVSHCSVVNDRRVRELVDEGAVDLLDVASATGAGSFCGGCQPALASIISGCTGEPASTLLDRAPSRLDDDTALPTRVRQVVRAIEEELRAGGAQVGDTVDDESELAARHDATRGTVRDALAVLAAHGVVRPDATGHVVAAPDPEVATVTSALHLVGAGVTPEEVGDVRRVLERLAVRCACHHPDPDGLARLRDDGGDVAVATGNPVLLLGVGVLREVAGAPGTDAGRARVVQAVLRADVSAALAEVDGWHVDAPSTIREARLLSTPLEPTTPLGIAVSLATIVSSDGLAPDQVIGTEGEVAERLGVDRRELQRAMPVLEHHAVVTRQPGPRATVAVATPDPWPAIEVLARALEWSGAEPGQLLHVRQSLEARAVELASTTIDEAAARRLRRRLDEESAAIRQAHLSDQVLHTIHPVLATLSGNRVLAHLAIAINLALVRRANRDPELARFLASSVGQLSRAHAAIVDATTRGDAAEGRRLVDVHGARHGAHGGDAVS